MRVMVVVPHMDDEVLGCGMAIASHVARGDDVAVLIVSNRAYGLKYCGKQIEREIECCRAAQRRLGYGSLLLGYDDTMTGLMADQEMYAHLNQAISLVEKRVSEFQPEACYVPWGGDVNQDHRTLYDACMVALRPTGMCRNVNAVYACEVASSTELIWSARAEFRPTVFVSGESLFRSKVEAWMEYVSEQRDSPNGRSLEKLEALARHRGARCAASFAEGFVCEYCHFSRGDDNGQVGVA